MANIRKMRNWKCRMYKIKTAIEELVASQPFLEEALAYSYLNLSSFAEYIRPLIEKRTHKPVTTASIKVALSRISAKNRQRKVFQFSADHFTFRNKIHILTLKKSEKNQELVKEIYGEAEEFSDTYLVVINGLKEIDILYGDILHPIVMRVIKESEIIQHVSDYAVVSIRLDSHLHQPGVLYTLTKKIYFLGINIPQIISTQSDLGILFRSSDDARRALEILIT